ncbi:MAG: rhodanese-related sulfurtransferase [Planctomycetota bacterium]
MYRVAAFYRFIRVEDPAGLRRWLLPLMRRLDVTGSILVASEGINGTVAAQPEAVDQLVAELRTQHPLGDSDFPGELEVKYSECADRPFRRCKVRLKREIVTMGVNGISPTEQVGQYVDPKRWNELLADPDVLVIDARNDYETAIGTFPGAVDPGTSSFRELPQFVDENLDPEKHRSVAMFCTGGIRCEKSTSLLKEKGFENVYHLKGGILRYFEETSPEENLFEGDCFVFDHRVAVGASLQPTKHVMCFGCGWAVDEEAQKSTDFRPGVHCPRCVTQLSNSQKARFAERQRQIDLARKNQEV